MQATAFSGLGAYQGAQAGCALGAATAFLISGHAVPTVVGGIVGAGLGLAVLVAVGKS